MTIRDNGIGMSRQDLVDNLGTIARSGTKAFMEQLSADGKKDAQLIGQFGVGFYSAFIVADRVTVTSRKAGETEAHVWESTGEGSYSLEPADKATRGTDITLHLRDDEKEFLESGRLSHLVRKYSDHIGLPVRLKVDAAEVETLNKAAALWTRPKSELTDEDYTGFYTHLAHDPGRPLTWGAPARRRQPELHLAALYPEHRPVRSLGSRQDSRPAAVREARLHHGSRRRAAAVVPALRQGSGRFR